MAGLLVCALLLFALAQVPLPDEVVAYLGRPRLDPVVGFVTLSLLVGAGAFAGWMPARRAARLDPMEVLRDE